MSEVNVLIVTGIVLFENGTSTVKEIELFPLEGDLTNSVGTFEFTG